MGVGVFLPADEQAAEAVEPGVGALDDPAAGAIARLVLERVGLVAAGADVGGEAELAYELVHLAVVVAAVEADAGCVLERVGESDRDRVEGCAQELLVADVGACDRQSEWYPGRVGEQAPLRALFGSVSGIGPAAIAAEEGTSAAPRRRPATPSPGL